MSGLVPMPVSAANIVGSQTTGSNIAGSQSAESQQVENQNVIDSETLENRGTIYIGTPQELTELAKNCIDDNWSLDKVVILENDIDMTGVEFSGIPTFGGIFLGQGYAVVFL